MDQSLLRAVRHNGWANDELIAFCARLSAEHHGWTVPGTMGTIHATLRHIVAAESGYLHGLTGEPAPGEEWSAETLPTFDELRGRARSNAQRLERLLAGPGYDPDRIVERRMANAKAAIVVAQYLHHGSDHRAHVGTILGAKGVEPPNLDVWAYGLTLGEVVRR